MTEEDIWLVDMYGSPRAEVFLATPYRESAPDLSPDGRWLAYESDESGRNEIYVRPIRRVGGKTQISTTGGRWPRWSRDGRQLLYVDGNRIMAVGVSTTDAALQAGRPVLRLEYPYYCGASPNYATLTGDGLLVIKLPPAPAPITRFIVVQDWLARVARVADHLHAASTSRSTGTTAAPRLDRGSGERPVVAPNNGVPSRQDLGMFLALDDLVVVSGSVRADRFQHARNR